jgi:hypothetical protein
MVRNFTGFAKLIIQELFQGHDIGISTMSREAILKQHQKDGPYLKKQRRDIQKGVASKADWKLEFSLPIFLDLQRE